jgi:hypothetical protein
MELLNIEQKWQARSEYTNKAIQAARLAHIHSTGFSIDEFEDHPELGNVRFSISYLQKGSTSVWEGWGAISYEILDTPAKAVETLITMGINRIEDKPAKKADTSVQWSEKAND